MTESGLWYRRAGNKGGTVAPCSPTLPIAGAFLALADDGAAPDQHSVPRAIAALLATVVLASCAPLLWVAAAGHQRSEPPAATLTSKVSLADEDV